MHRFQWGLFCCQILVTLTAGSPIAGSPTPSIPPESDLVKRVSLPPVAYPYGTEHRNEMRWKNWDLKDANQGAAAKIIHDSYPIMLEMVVLAYKEAEARSTTFKRWFGPNDAVNVMNVLERIVSMPSKNQPNDKPQITERMKDRVLRQDDYSAPEGCQTPGVYAYTSDTSGIFHICPKGIADRDMAKMKCQDLDSAPRGKKTDYLSSRKISSVAKTMLHEAVHWQQIGNPVLAKDIVDHAYGAYKCSTLSNSQKLTNADNYAFLASEAYMQTKGCKFVNPDKKIAIAEGEEGASHTKSISIIYRSSVDKNWAENDWYVYQTPVDVSALCNPADQTVAKWPADDGPWPTVLPSGAPWPAGIFDITVDGMDCQYKNDNTDPGALWCKGRSSAISCWEDPRLDEKEGKFCDGGRIYQQPYVYCTW